jgi:hypothetical protein
MLTLRLSGFDPEADLRTEAEGEGVPPVNEDRISSRRIATWLVCRRN